MRWFPRSLNPLMLLQMENERFHRMTKRIRGFCLAFKNPIEAVIGLLEPPKITCEIAMMNILPNGAVLIDARCGNRRGRFRVLQ